MTYLNIPAKKMSYWGYSLIIARQWNNSAKMMSKFPNPTGMRAYLVFYPKNRVHRRMFGMKMQPHRVHYGSHYQLFLLYLEDKNNLEEKNEKKIYLDTENNRVDWRNLSDTSYCKTPQINRHLGNRSCTPGIARPIDSLIPNYYVRKFSD